MWRIVIINTIFRQPGTIKYLRQRTKNYKNRFITQICKLLDLHFREKNRSCGHVENELAHWNEQKFIAVFG